MQTIGAGPSIPPPPAATTPNPPIPNTLATASGANVNTPPTHRRRQRLTEVQDLIASAPSPTLGKRKLKEGNPQVEDNEEMEGDVEGDEQAEVLPTMKRLRSSKGKGKQVVRDDKAASLSSGSAANSIVEQRKQVRAEARSGVANLIKAVSLPSFN